MIFSARSSLSTPSDKPPGELSDYENAVRGIQHLHRLNPDDNIIERNLFE